MDQMDYGAVLPPSLMVFFFECFPYLLVCYLNKGLFSQIIGRTRYSTGVPAYQLSGGSITLESILPYLSLELKIFIGLGAFGSSSVIISSQIHFQGYFLFIEAV